MKNKFKVGQWIFCEFKLQIIKKMNGDNIISVSDGWCSHGSTSLNDRCFQMSLDVKIASDTTKIYYDNIHDLKINGLNFPDITRKFIELWVSICEENDKDEVQKKYNKLAEFKNSIIKSVRELTDNYVDNVRLFR